MILTSLLLCVCVGWVVAHPGGAPMYVCDSMMPYHGADPQSGYSTVNVTVSKTTYLPGDKIEVTLAGQKGEYFKGFLIEPRTSTNNSYSTVGTLSGPHGTTNYCRDMVSLTHSDSKNKTSLTFTWTAPPTNVGPVNFVYTVVKDKRMFWIFQTSATITQAPVG